MFGSKAKIGEVTGAALRHLMRCDEVRTNGQRAAEGKLLCDLMEALTGVDDEDSKASDAICQILHYCRSEGIDFERAIQNARANLEAEILEDPV